MFCFVVDFIFILLLFQLNVCFDGPEDLEFSQSWCEQRIEANDTKLLELFWFPTSEYSERHNIKLNTAKQLWNIPITFKSVLPKASNSLSNS